MLNSSNYLQNIFLFFIIIFFQVITSPITISFINSNSNKNSNLLLSGIQFRGHSLYSDFEVPYNIETLEYAWLIEIIFGNITGKIDLKNV